MCGLELLWNGSSGWLRVRVWRLRVRVWRLRVRVLRLRVRVWRLRMRRGAAKAGRMPGALSAHACAGRGAGMGKGGAITAGLFLKEFIEKDVRPRHHLTAAAAAVA